MSKITVREVLAGLASRELVDGHQMNVGPDVNVPTLMVIDRHFNWVVRDGADVQCSHYIAREHFKRVFSHLPLSDFANRYVLFVSPSAAEFQIDTLGGVYVFCDGDYDEERRAKWPGWARETIAGMKNGETLVRQRDGRRHMFCKMVMNLYIGNHGDAASTMGQAGWLLRTARDYDTRERCVPVIPSAALLCHVQYYESNREDWVDSLLTKFPSMVAVYTINDIPCVINAVIAWAIHVFKRVGFLCAPEIITERYFPVEGLDVILRVKQSKLYEMTQTSNPVSTLWAATRGLVIPDLVAATGATALGLAGDVVEALVWNKATVDRLLALGDLQSMLSLYEVVVTPRDPEKHPDRTYPAVDLLKYFQMSWQHSCGNAASVRGRRSDGCWQAEVLYKSGACVMRKYTVGSPGIKQFQFESDLIPLVTRAYCNYLVLPLEHYISSSKFYSSVSLFQAGPQFAQKVMEVVDSPWWSFNQKAKEESLLRESSEVVRTKINTAEYWKGVDAPDADLEYTPGVWNALCWAYMNYHAIVWSSNDRGVVATNFRTVVTMGATALLEQISLGVFGSTYAEQAEEQLGTVRDPRYKLYVPSKPIVHLTTLVRRLSPKILDSALSIMGFTIPREIHSVDACMLVLPTGEGDKWCMSYINEWVEQPVNCFEVLGMAAAPTHDEVRRYCIQKGYALVERNENGLKLLVQPKVEQAQVLTFSKPLHYATKNFVTLTQGTVLDEMTHGTRAFVEGLLADITTVRGMVVSRPMLQADATGLTRLDLGGAAGLACHGLSWCQHEVKEMYRSMVRSWGDGMSKEDIEYDVSTSFLSTVSRTHAKAKVVMVERRGDHVGHVRITPRPVNLCWERKAANQLCDNRHVDFSKLCHDRGTLKNLMRVLMALVFLRSVCPPGRHRISIGYFGSGECLWLKYAIKYATETLLFDTEWRLYDPLAAPLIELPTNVQYIKEPFNPLAGNWYDVVFVDVATPTGVYGDITARDFKNVSGIVDLKSRTEGYKLPHMEVRSTELIACRYTGNLISLDDMKAAFRAVLGNEAALDCAAACVSMSGCDCGCCSFLAPFLRDWHELPNVPLDYHTKRAYATLLQEDVLDDRTGSPVWCQRERLRPTTCFDAESQFQVGYNREGRWVEVEQCRRKAMSIRVPNFCLDNAPVDLVLRITTPWGWKPPVSEVFATDVASDRVFRSTSHVYREQAGEWYYINVDITNSAYWGTNFAQAVPAAENEVVYLHCTFDPNGRPPGELCVLTDKNLENVAPRRVGFDGRNVRPIPDAAPVVQAPAAAPVMPVLPLQPAMAPLNVNHMAWEEIPDVDLPAIHEILRPGAEKWVEHGFRVSTIRPKHFRFVLPFVHVVAYERHNRARIMDYGANLDWVKTLLNNMHARTKDVVIDFSKVQTLSAVAAGLKTTSLYAIMEACVATQRSVLFVSAKTAKDDAKKKFKSPLVQCCTYEVGTAKLLDTTSKFNTVIFDEVYSLGMVPTSIAIEAALGSAEHVVLSGDDSQMTTFADDEQVAQYVDNWLECIASSVSLKNWTSMITPPNVAKIVQTFPGLEAFETKGTTDATLIWQPWDCEDRPRLEHKEDELHIFVNRNYKLADGTLGETAAVVQGGRASSVHIWLTPNWRAVMNANRRQVNAVMYVALTRVKDGGRVTVHGSEVDKRTLVWFSQFQQVGIHGALVHKLISLEHVASDEIKVSVETTKDFGSKAKTTRTYKGIVSGIPFVRGSLFSETPEFISHRNFGGMQTIPALQQARAFVNTLREPGPGGNLAAAIGLRQQTQQFAEVNAKFDLGQQVKLSNKSVYTTSLLREPVRALWQHPKQIAQSFAGSIGRAGYVNPINSQPEDKLRRFAKQIAAWRMKKLDKKLTVELERHFHNYRWVLETCQAEQVKAFVDKEWADVEMPADVDKVVMAAKNFKLSDLNSYTNCLSKRQTKVNEHTPGYENKFKGDQIIYTGVQGKGLHLWFSVIASRLEAKMMQTFAEACGHFVGSASGETPIARIKKAMKYGNWRLRSVLNMDIDFQDGGVNALTLALVEETMLALFERFGMGDEVFRRIWQERLKAYFAKAKNVILGLLYWCKWHEPSGHERTFSDNSAETFVILDLILALAWDRLPEKADVLWLLDQEDVTKFLNDEYTDSWRMGSGDDGAAEFEGVDVDRIRAFMSPWRSLKLHYSRGCFEFCHWVVAGPGRIYPSIFRVFMKMMNKTHAKDDCAAYEQYMFSIQETLRVNVASDRWVADCALASGMKPGMLEDILVWLKAISKLPFKAYLRECHYVTLKCGFV